MPLKPVDRLLFAQGGRCFFCNHPLPITEASVEHLVARANGGHDSDENCVACCLTLNRIFGCMSLKEKLQIVLNQNGKFKCPAGLPSAQVAAPQLAPIPHLAPAPKPVSSPLPVPKPVPAPKPAEQKPAAKTPRTSAEKFALVVASLQKNPKSNPGTVEKLLNTIKCHLNLRNSGNEADALLQQLIAKGYVTVAGEKVTYALLRQGV